ncbi:hypothetical protein [Nocardia wallacei]|uniref:hypothetical protein n=1 Tax=Nocardia wallacei TaxID=480035 RepID=UPI002457CF68|nr:hypothetical protein [Nocardia wallacei]
MHEEESREEVLYRGLHDDQSLKLALHMTKQIELACAKFYAFVSACDRVEKDAKQEVHHDSLWWYFDVWLAPHLQDNEFHPSRPEWHHLSGEPLTFAQFRNLIPAIYLKIATEYLRDPSRLDFIRTGSWRHGRLRTQVALQLVWLLFTLTGESWRRWPHLRNYLDTKISREGYPGRIPRRVTSLLPPFGTPDDGTPSWGRTTDMAPTAEEIEHGEILTLICGAFSHWPVRTYDTPYMDLIR